MGGEKRYPYAEALAVAEALKAELQHACERIEIAGSLRRKKQDVGDIELLCIPAIDDAALFAYDALDVRLQKMIQTGILIYRLSTTGKRTYGPKNKLLVHVASGIPLDVFTADAQNWGMALVVRTGSADFNKRMMATFQQRHMAGHAYGGITASNGEEIECPDEETVFRNLGWAYLDPAQRL